MNVNEVIMNEENKWKQLRLFLLERIVQPTKHPEFIFYFILVIIGIGAIGIYSAAFSENIPASKNEFIISNMASYFLAIIATGSVDLIFLQRTNIKRAILLMSVGAIFTNTFLFFLSINYSSYLFSSIGITIAVVVWWIANAENSNIIESTFNNDIRDEAKNIHGKTW